MKAVDILTFTFGGANVRFSRDVTGLPVIHAATGREVGKVSEWLLDIKGEAVAAFISEGSGWLPQRRVFSFRDILELGSDAIFVCKDGSHAAGDPPEIDGHPTQRVLGKRVLSEKGEDLGVVEDVLFEENAGCVTGWRLSSGLIDDILRGRQVVGSQTRVNIGENVVVLSD